MKTLLDAWQASNQRFEALLSRLYQNHGEPQSLLFEAMDYSLLAGGKRLRPFLVYQFCQACGGSPETADSAALAVEMVHTYSLIHDDLPAMDNDDYRRGRLTNHKVYGEAEAILAGDGLLTDAFRVLAQAESLTPEQISSCVGCLALNAGPWGMVGGQVLDMLSETRELTEQEVRAIQSRKTGCLIKAACCLGVICGGGTIQQMAAAMKYADRVGLAFQVRDDMLDQIGDAKKLGKATGVDGKKNTFLKLYGLEGCEKLIQAQTDQAIAALEAFRDPETLTALARYLTNREY